jgi:hypothetical protein
MLAVEYRFEPYWRVRKETRLKEKKTANTGMLIVTILPVPAYDKKNPIGTVAVAVPVRYQHQIDSLFNEITIVWKNNKKMRRIRNQNFLHVGSGSNFLKIIMIWI